MTTVATITDLVDNIVTYQSNPALIQSSVFNHLDAVMNGSINIVDPTNPLVVGLESSAVMVSGFFSEAATLTRQQYPELSQQESDLYYHMSDSDYVGRFATPASAKIQFALAKDELINALKLDSTLGVYKAVIPRNTRVNVGGVYFSLQYPINIVQQTHGGLQISFDTTQQSPLQSLSTNVIDWNEVTLNGLEWIHFTVEMFQFNIQTSNLKVSLSAPISANLQVSDQFYACRVYYQDSTTNQWVEIKTTHSPRVYDPTVVTAVLQLVDSQLNVSIPLIYISQRIIKSVIRIDLYQTKGNISMDLSSFPLSSFQIDWLAIDTADQTPFVAAIQSMKTVQAFSGDMAKDGSDGLTFTQQRDRVINNVLGPQQYPITNVQMEDKLSISGYDVVKDVDNLTNRRFLATRRLPPPSSSSLITAANASVATITSNFADAINTNDGTVLDNGTTITITPNTLYKSTNGVMSFVPASEVKGLLSLTPDDRAATVSAADYFYSPFHYVLDASSSGFETRAYYLDAPVANSKVFVAQNDTTLLQVSTDTFTIQKTSTGYQLRVVTVSNSAYQALDDSKVFAQLAYVPEGETNYAYLNGVLAGKTAAQGERIWTFDLSTNFNVTSDDALQLLKFLMFDNTPRLTGASLNTSFEILYSTSVALGSQWVPNSIDQVLGTFLLPSQIAAITHEQIKVQFGSALKNLWNSSRTNVAGTVYKTYLADVVATWPEDVYQEDPATGSSITIDADGNAQMRLLHRKGDPVYSTGGTDVYGNAYGEIQYIHRKGDPVLDDAGNPIPLSPRSVEYQFDVMIVEGTYWFATDPTSASYRSEMIATFVNWITVDLAQLQQLALEKTGIYFYPKSTVGLISVMLPDGTTTQIEAAQNFALDLYVSDTVMNNAKLKVALQESTINILNQILDQTLVTRKDIVSALAQAYGSDVQAFDFRGLGGTSNYPALSMVDKTARLSIRKTLVAQPDNTLIVDVGVDVQFKSYNPS